MTQMPCVNRIVALADLRRERQLGSPLPMVETATTFTDVEQALA